MTNVTKAALTPARRRLVELMQEVNYGRLEGLEVRDCEPVLDPPPRVVRQIVFGKDNGPNMLGAVAQGFALKKKGSRAVRGLRPGAFGPDPRTRDRQRASRPHGRGGRDPDLSPGPTETARSMHQTTGWPQQAEVVVGVAETGVPQRFRLFVLRAVVPAQVDTRTNSSPAPRRLNGCRQLRR